MNVFQTIEVEECCNCHMQFGMTAAFIKQRRDDHKAFYCPAGHGQNYTGETEAEKLRRENQRLIQRMAERDDDVKHARDQRDHAQNQTRAFKGQVTKIKNRVGNGVCPCCNRTFANLANHMASKHKDYAGEAA